MRNLFKCALAVLVGSLFSVQAWAALSSVGNITPAIDPLGYGIPGQPGSTGPVTVGIIDVGGLFINQQFEPGPLISTGEGIVGRDEGSYGAVDLTDFFSDWLMTGNFYVGRSGIGVVDIKDSAKIQVGPYNFPAITPPPDVVAGTSLTTIGQLETGLGTITLSGIAGSRLVTADLIVGDLGVGNLTAISRSTVFTDDAYIGNSDNSTGFVSISDLGTRWTVGDTATTGILFVGNKVGDGDVGEAAGEDLNGLGKGTLRIANQGLVQVSDSVYVGPSGRVELVTEGRLRILPTSEAQEMEDDDDIIVQDGSVIVNDGVIMGDGFIEFGSETSGTGTTDPHFFVNRAGGEIRNSDNATDTPTGGSTGGTQREKLIFNATALNGDLLINDGTIESIGGEMEFNVPVINNFEIIARDAIMRFPQGVTVNDDGVPGVPPDGIFIVGGDSTIHGTVNFAPMGGFVVLSDSIITVQGDLVFTEPFLLVADDDEEELARAIDGDTGLYPPAILTMSIGAESGSSMNITGNLDLTNAALELDFAGLQSPTIGSIYNLLTFGGSLTGEFDNSSVVADGHRFDIGYTASSVFLTYAGLSTGMPGDFDNDGDVDGRDFLAWQRNPSLGDLADWRSNYGTGGLTGNFASVPEPSALVLGLAALVVVFQRNTRRIS